jgi:hypothetical protein
MYLKTLWLCDSMAIKGVPVPMTKPQRQSPTDKGDKRPQITQKQFGDVLRKVSRKISPKKS